MFERQKPEPEAPPCPLCMSDMILKQVHHELLADHFIFKCGKCAVEYPVVAAKRE